MTADRGPRTFDPVAVGRRECDAWVHYYRHEWASLLHSSIGLVDAAFGMNRWRTLAGAWYVARANQAWAPVRDNDPDQARAEMRRFYELVAADGRLQLHPAEAARREVEWWRIHRIHQREDGLSEDDLIAALVDLYAYIYGVEPDSIRCAAEQRVLAMRLSDEWVAAGRSLNDPLLTRQRLALVASYTALREALERA